MFRLVSLGYSPPRRRAGRLLRLASPTPESTTPVSELSDLEFQFSAGVSDSDTDSLPELDDSSTSTASTRSLLTPFRPSVSYFDTFELPLKRLSLAPALTPLRNATYVEDMDVDIQISQPEPISQPSIFEIPELVHKIIVYADAQNTVIPREKTPVCRKPLSFQHALLVHGNEEAAKLAMEGAFSTLQEPQPSNRLNVLHTCLLVNKLFHHITKEILGERLFFTEERTLAKFIAPKSSQQFYDGMSPKTLVLSKMLFLRQPHFNSIAANINLSRLEWLELYMCPKIAPTRSFLLPTLKTLIVTGSKALEDTKLAAVASTCPNLKYLTYGLAKMLLTMESTW